MGERTAAGDSPVIEVDGDVVRLRRSASFERVDRGLRVLTTLGATAIIVVIAVAVAGVAGLAIGVGGSLLVLAIAVRLLVRHQRRGTEMITVTAGELILGTEQGRVLRRAGRTEVASVAFGFSGGEREGVRFFLTLIDPSGGVSSWPLRGKWSAKEQEQLFAQTWLQRSPPPPKLTPRRKRSAS